MRKFQLIHGNSKEVLKPFPNNIFQCCVTSPPYWQLRDYFEKEQLGQEKSSEEYIQNLVEIFREVKRVLRKDGILWVVIGDTYVRADFKKRGILTNLKVKNLVGIPWKLAFALQKDGWYLRCDVIWQKTNVLPDGAKDRPTRSHEYIFQFTKSSKYFYDYYAVLEKAKSERIKRETGFGAKHQKGTFRMDQKRVFIDYGTKNKRSIWISSVASSKNVHFAVFPLKLINTAVKASVSKKGCCSKCRAPWKRILEKVKETDNSYSLELRSRGWKPTCKCLNTNVIPCLVLDPFAGTSTTGVAAFMNHADYVGIDLNANYLKLSKDKLMTEDCLGENDIFVEQEEDYNGNTRTKKN